MKRHLDFASHPGNLALVRDFVRDFLAAVDLPDPEKNLIVLGLDEACTNVIRYAYKLECDRLITLECEREGRTLIFRLRDYGCQPDCTKIEGRPLDLIQPGGLGIHLIRRAFTEVDYRLQKEGTELVLRRELEGPETGPAAAAPR